MKEKEVRVSVVIPNYNGEKTILKTLNSLKAVDCEILIIDDGSKDDSIKIINDFINKNGKNKENIKLIKNLKNKGAAYCRNLGIKKSSGKIIVFIDNDIYLYKDCMEKLVDGIRDYDIAFPKMIFENRKIMYPINKEEESYPRISSCFAIKRDSMKKLDGLFDEYYKTYCEDADFFLRCKYYGLKPKYIKEAVAVHCIKEFSNAERRYFLENRNLVYGMIKLRKVLRETDLENPFNLKSLFKNFICGIFNFRWFDYSHYPRGKNTNLRLKMLLKKHKRITKKPSILLIGIFLYAIMSSLLHIVFIRILRNESK